MSIMLARVFVSPEIRARLLSVLRNANLNYASRVSFSRANYVLTSRPLASGGREILGLRYTSLRQSYPHKQVQTNHPRSAGCTALIRLLPSISREAES